MARLQEYDVSTTFEGKVLESTRITPEDSPDEVRHIVLEVDKGEFHFKLGQSVGLLIPGPHEFGNENHFRLYSVASTEKGEKPGTSTMSLCVRRCFYIDEVNGERYPGVASNYLCDLQPGDTITLTGPYGIAFTLPEDPTANILMIGMGTGIAPFRAFVKHIYDEVGEWKGKVRLFYGAKRGMELLYMNDQKNDLGNYYDKETFKAFESVSPRPHLNEPVDLERTLSENASEVWEMLQDPNTYVYVAGLEQVSDMLDKALAKMAGSDEKWLRLKKHLIACDRWAELIY
ncbi:MAG: oxidoreductase [Candidatus Hydrogenedentes bacterium]|nr:oxidoreductase [Candidatus Hydrogenedentota bacterium]